MLGTDSRDIIGQLDANNRALLSINSSNHVDVQKFLDNFFLRSLEIFLKKTKKNINDPEEPNQRSSKPSTRDRRLSLGSNENPFSFSEYFLKIALAATRCFAFSCTRMPRICRFVLPVREMEIWWQL